MNPSRFLSRTRCFLYAPDAPEGSTTPQGTTVVTTTPAPQSSQPDIAAAVAAQVADILNAKNGDKDSALETLIRKNHRLEQRAKDAEAKVGQLPAEVQAELEAYRVHGKPDEIKARLENGDKATAEAQQMRRDTLISRAASTYGFDEDVLREKLGESALEEYEAADGEKTVKAFRVEGSEKPLPEYAAEQWPKYLPVLQPSQAPASPARPAAPIMGAGGRPAGNRYDSIRQEVQAKQSANAEGRDLSRAGIT